MRKLALGVVGGRGLIGSTLLDQLVNQRPKLFAVHGIDLCVVAIANTKKQLLVDEIGAEWRAVFDAAETPPGWMAFESALDNGDAGVVIDCTASDSTSNRYATWLEKVC